METAMSPSGRFRLNSGPSPRSLRAATLAAALLLIPAVHVAQDSVRLKSGRTLTGKIVSRDENSITLDNRGIEMSIGRHEIESIRSGSSTMLPGLRPPQSERVLQAGPGGLTQDEVDRCLNEAAAAARKSADQLSEEEKQSALNRAVEDELLFQAAIQDGALENYEVRRAILTLYRNRQNRSGAKPASGAAPGSQVEFENALREGIGREPTIRRRIISQYLADRKSDRATVVAELKTRFESEQTGKSQGTAALGSLRIPGFGEEAGGKAGKPAPTPTPTPKPDAGSALDKARSFLETLKPAD